MTTTHVRTISEEDLDLRYIPAYTLAEVSRYLGVPGSTVRAWVHGQRYILGEEKRFFKPLIVRPDETLSRLSFINVIEVHVLSAIRRVHRVSLQKVRIALDYIESQFCEKHPLATVQFHTDGIDLFVRQVDQLVNLSSGGQLAMREVLEAFLRRVDRDEDGIASRLYPFIRPGPPAEQPRIVVIDPRMCFGRPSIAGTGIATEILAERYKAGESVDELAADYNLERYRVEEALRCELSARAA
jgi:uncharacterized protein (DUF433 family)